MQYSCLICSPLPPIAVTQPGHEMYTTASRVPKLCRSLPATSDLPSLCNGDAGRLPVDMSFDFQLRNHRRLRCFHDAGAGGGGNDCLQTICREVGKKLGDAVESLVPKKYDIIYSKRLGFVEVPQGRLVSEREWAASESGRKIKFSPRIGVSLQ